MPVHAVIFDFGHTLMHLKGTWPEVFDRGIADLSAYLAIRAPDLDREALCQTLLDRRREGFARAAETMREVTAEESMRGAFAQVGVPDPNPALLLGAIDAFFAYEEGCWFLDPAAEEVLETLAGRGLKLGLFSNATHDPFIQRLVDRLRLRRWLDPTLSSAGTGVRKPDPAAFAPFPAAWGLLPASVVVVGDTLDQDVLGAQRAGMRGVWIRSREFTRQEGGGYGDAGRAEQIRPDAIVERLADLPTALDALG